MKSPSTLIKYHEKAICIVELMAKAEQRFDMLNKRLNEWDSSEHWFSPMRMMYMFRSQLENEILICSKAIARLQQYYLNLITKMS